MTLTEKRLKAIQDARAILDAAKAAVTQEVSTDLIVVTVGKEPK